MLGTRARNYKSDEHISVGLPDTPNIGTVPIFCAVLILCVRKRGFSSRQFNLDNDPGKLINPTGRC